MYGYGGIKVVHLEMTTRCNASCPMCPRNIQGGRVNPIVPLTELSLSDVKTLFPDELIARLERMYMCGNYGDAMTARDTLEVFEHFRRVNPKMRLRLYTNASGRDAAWWARLAKTVDVCTFSVDGLKDTNHLYRRGTEWPKIMASMKAFIGAGGEAEWEFLIFKHNEHQVEAARALAAELGVARFIPKRTDRFLTGGKVSPTFPVLDAEGRVEYELEMPTAAENRNAAVASIGGILKQNRTFGSYLEETQVCCKVEAGGPMYVTAEGLVFPCCWLANLYPPGKPLQSGEVWDLIKTLPEGKDSLNALKRPMREIVDGPFFQSLVPERWQPSAPGRKKLTICARICGQFDPNGAMRSAGAASDERYRSTR